MTFDPEFRRLFVYRLWTNILDATDATLPTRDRTRARRFLLAGAGFDDACLKAGLDPERVRHHTRNLLGIDANAAVQAKPIVSLAHDRKPSNRGRTPDFIRFAGKVMTRKQWSTETGIPVATIAMRLHKGWPVDRTLTTPHRPRGHHHDRGVGRAQTMHAGTGALPTAQISA